MFHLDFRRCVLLVVLMTASNGVQASRPHDSAFASTYPLLSPPALRLRSSGHTVSMCLPQQQSRRETLFGLASLIVGSSLIDVRTAAAEEAPAAAAEGVKVCTNILGCPITEPLAPPKRVYKSILEEEQELARQQAEIAEKARQEKRNEQFKILRGIFAVIKKGRNEMEKDITEAAAAGAKDPEDKKAWDDLRRMSRLYDTGLRKDGMLPAMDMMKKLKIEFDRKPADEACKSLNQALKEIDKSGKKKDVELAKQMLQKALEAVDAWFAIEANIDSASSA